MCSALGTFTPQLEQSCDVPDGFTAITSNPAFSALVLRIDRKFDHPASCTDLAIMEREKPLTFKSS
jgi:hypothetical protein